MAQYIHYDPDRVDWTVSEHELDSIVSLSSNSWKDFSIGLLGIGIPCAINAWSSIAGQATFALTLPIFLNTFAGALGIVLGGIFLIVWLRTRTRASVIVSQIKSKPRIEMPLTNTTATTLSAAPASASPSAGSP